MKLFSLVVLEAAFFISPSLKRVIYIDLARPKSGAPHLFFMLVGR